MRYLTSITLPATALAASGVLLLALAGCGKEEAMAPAGLAPQAVTDMLHAVMAADRKVYTTNVVNRLVLDQKVEVMDPETKQPKKLAGSEFWEKTHATLPLPAQQFRYASEEAYKMNQNFSYGLISSWAINKNNLPRSEFEKQKIKEVEAAGVPQYGEEEVAGQKFFIAMYPDKAVAKACFDCHNNHKDSPRSDFKADEVMGAVVIRLPM